MIQIIPFKKLHPAAFLPKSWSAEAVGLDLHACLISETGRDNTSMIPPNSVRNIGTGLAAETPIGFWLGVCSRSGLALKSLFVANAPGVIDPDFRGEIKVLLYNGSHQAQYVKHGDRIAQLVLFPHCIPSAIEVDVLSETLRGDAGLGSTGQ